MVEPLDWSQSSAYGRFSRFGPYYAMFPTSFVIDVLGGVGKKAAYVLDPFCGRGTVPFVAAALGARGVGIDLNAVAWVYAASKADIPSDVGALIARIAEVEREAKHEDGTPEHEFQEWCWSPRVLAFLRAARRVLDWKGEPVDRMLMASILVVLHAKLGEGLSNQMRQAKAMAPEYSVKWWKRQGVPAPDVDPGEVLRAKMLWRYAKGVPKLNGRAEIHMGEASSVLDNMEALPPADLVLTSPPYAGVTDYRYDNWIRLWMLGGPSLPAGTGTELRYASRDKFSAMIETVFEAVRRRSAPEAVVFVRTDARPFTLRATTEALRRSWPDHAIRYRHDAPQRSQTELYSGKAPIVGEVDVLMTPKPVRIAGFRRASGAEDVVAGVAAGRR